MAYRRCVVRRGSAGILALAFLIAASCGGTSTTGSTAATQSTAAATATASVAAATGAPTASGLGLGQVLTSARASEYKVTYVQTVTGAGASTGQQSWYFKPPKTRYDFSNTVGGQTTTVSLFALPDGTFMCFGAGGQSQCIGMSGLSTALQQNPAAAMQATMLQRPDQFSGVLAETRQIAGQQALCYDVRSNVNPTATDRFCYTAQGISLLQRFATPGGTWSLEATQVSTTVPDSDFTLPAKPTVIGTP